MYSSIPISEHDPRAEPPGERMGEANAASIAAAIHGGCPFLFCISSHVHLSWAAGRPCVLPFGGFPLRGRRGRIAAATLHISIL